MGFLDKMKSVFLEEEEGDSQPAAPQAAAQQQPAAQQNSAPTVSAAPMLSANTPQGEGRINPDLLIKFEKALNEFDLPGPDYLELKRVIDNENFRKNIPDEKQRILSAFFSIQAGNPTFSKKIVLDSLQHYVDKMEGERAKAQQQLGQRIEEEINGPMKQVESKRQRIEQLNAEIAKIQQEIATELTEIESKRAALNSKKLDFDATINALIGALKADMVKIDNAIN